MTIYALFPVNHEFPFTSSHLLHDVSLAFSFSELLKDELFSKTLKTSWMFLLKLPYALSYSLLSSLLLTSLLMAFYWNSFPWSYNWPSTYQILGSVLSLPQLDLSVTLTPLAVLLFLKLFSSLDSKGSHFQSLVFIVLLIILSLL